MREENDFGGLKPASGKQTGRRIARRPVSISIRSSYRTSIIRRVALRSPASSRAT